MQKIVVFQQNGSGEGKIEGIRKHGRDIDISRVYSIDEALPPVIDDAEEYLPESLDADLVLDFLKHPDLSYELAKICGKLNIPVVSSGKKHQVKGAFTPPTCCGLRKNDRLGEYANQFGSPEFRVTLKDGRVSGVEVLRGASCGATWEAAIGVIGMTPEEAATRIGLEVQFFCRADPAGWDPIYGKSPVHFAGDVHKAGFLKAVNASDD